MPKLVHKDTLHQGPGAGLWSLIPITLGELWNQLPPKTTGKSTSHSGPYHWVSSSCTAQVRALVGAWRATWCVKLMSVLLSSLMAWISPWDYKHQAWIDLWLPWDAAWSRSSEQAVIDKVLLTCFYECGNSKIKHSNQKCFILPFLWWLKRAKLIAAPGCLYWAISAATGWHRLAHQLHCYSMKAHFGIIKKSEEKNGWSIAIYCVY